MHKVPVDRLERGVRLGKSIYGAREEHVPARGTILSNEYLIKLRERGFHFAYVLDGIADDVEPTGFISERLRAANVRNLQTIYELMAEATQPNRDQAAEAGRTCSPSCRSSSMKWSSST